MGEGAETMQSRGGGSKIFRNEGDHPKSGGVVFEMGSLNPSTKYGKILPFLLRFKWCRQK